MRLPRRFARSAVLLAGAIVGAPAAGQQPAPPDARPPSKIEVPAPGGLETARQATLKLVEQLKRHPPQVSKVDDPLRLFLLDRQEGSVTLVADEPDPGSNHIGSPRWSHDGRRILFDAMRGTEYQNLHIKALECGPEGPKLTDLGLGACPSWSPDDRRLAFLLNSPNEAVEQTGIWVMEADGSQRRRAGEYGIPLWSPDGHSFLIVTFGEPRHLKVIDAAKGQVHEFEVPGGSIRSWPSWAGGDLLVAVIGTEKTSNAVALVDVRRNEPEAIKAILWRRSPQLDVSPAWPVFSAATRRCVFVGETAQGMALYEVEQGKPAEVKRLEKGGLDQRIAGLSLSPDGRFLLFCSTRQPAAPR